MSDGDEVQFLWEGDHNVYRMKDKTAFDACDFVGSTPIGKAFDTSGVRQVISSGDGMIHYFACKVGSHCSVGQKLAIIIVGTGDQDVKQQANAKPAAPPAKAWVSAGTRCGFPRLLFVLMLTLSLHQ